nr:RNA-directed DNA polymerase, eukaryota [Tanacetum cinerariifolium]
MKGLTRSIGKGCRFTYSTTWCLSINLPAVTGIYKDRAAPSEIAVIGNGSDDFMSQGSVSIDVSFRRGVRGGVERQQWDDLQSLMQSVFLSSSGDRWICDLSGDGEYRVKEVCNFIDDLFLPSHPEVTRWVKCIPKKINIFVWRARRDCLPTRQNLIRRGVVLESDVCPLCEDSVEEPRHVFFQCSIAQCVIYRICRWWDLDGQNLTSFSDWQTWFLSIRLPSKTKMLLEGVFYVAWWYIWGFGNRRVFYESPPRR